MENSKFPACPAGRQISNFKFFQKDLKMRGVFKEEVNGEIFRS